MSLTPVSVIPVPVGAQFLVKEKWFDCAPEDVPWFRKHGYEARLLYSERDFEKVKREARTKAGEEVEWVRQLLFEHGYVGPLTEACPLREMLKK